MSDVRIGLTLELLPTEVLHWRNRNIRLFWLLWPVVREDTSYVQIELPMSRLSKVIVWQTDIQTRPKSYTTLLSRWSKIRLFSNETNNYSFSFTTHLSTTKSYLTFLKHWLIALIRLFDEIMCIITLLLQLWQHRLQISWCSLARCYLLFCLGHNATQLIQQPPLHVCDALTCMLWHLVQAQHAFAAHRNLTTHKCTCAQFQSSSKRMVSTSDRTVRPQPDRAQFRNINNLDLVKPNWVRDSICACVRSLFANFFNVENVTYRLTLPAVAGDEYLTRVQGVCRLQPVSYAASYTTYLVQMLSMDRVRLEKYSLTEPKDIGPV